LKKKKEKAPVVRSFSENIDYFLGKNDLVWFWTLFAVTMISGILLFDPRVSAGGDDSAYILSAHDFLKEFKFPSYQGPLYPIILSLVDAVSGMSVSALKSFSLVAMLAFLYFMFAAFRKRIPNTLLFVTLLLTAVNSQLLYFTSQTYSETFYMFLQALLLYTFFRLFIDREAQKTTISADLKRHLLLGITLLGAILTRSIGYSIFFAIVGYFICSKQWKNIAYFAVCFLACFGIYQLLKYAIWGDASLQATGQGSSLLYKDFYHPEYGREDLPGFIKRFWDNTNQYISRSFMVMLGIRDNFADDGVYSQVKPMISILVYLLGLSGIWLSFKNNKYLFFTGLVTAFFILVTFVILQVSWNQIRLIIPIFSLLLLLLLTALHYLGQIPKLRLCRLLIIPVTILFFPILSTTSQAVKEARKIKNEYSGLTPDWLHYTQASAWAGKNLPDSALVACRKPEISAIYAKGKKFHAIRRVESGNFDAFIKRWTESGKGYAAVKANGIAGDLYTFLLSRYEARAIIGDIHYLIVNYSEQTHQTLAQHWPDAKVYATVGELQALLNNSADANKPSIYYADSLLIQLKNNRVTHILTANLRLNPYVKNGQIINSVERSAIFIQEKYPNLFTLVQRFGDQNDESADIIRINWDTVEEKH
jgi:hypothetical protein